MKTLRQIIKESHYPTQGSSVEYPEYQEMDMENLVKDAIKDVDEDDGPHTSDVGHAPNFTTTVDPTTVVNQPNSEGNREFPTAVATRKPGKPFKSFRSKTAMAAESVVDEEQEPVVEYQRGLWRPQEAGMNKSGTEKGKGVVTTYHYQKKSSNTPTGAKIKMGGVDVHLGTSKKSTRRKKST
jgi:hypothetical protein